MSRSKGKAGYGQQAQRPKQAGKPAVDSETGTQPLWPPRLSTSWFAHAVLAGGLLVASVLFVPGLADEFRLPKLALLETVGLLSVLLLLIARESAIRDIDRRLAISCGALFAAAAVSVALGEHQAHGSNALWSLAVGLVVMLAWSGRGLRHRRILSWLVAPALINATVIVLQRLDLWQPLGVAVRRSRMQLTGFIGNSGEASLFITLPLAFCVVGVYRSLRAGRAARAFLWGVISAVLIAAVAATETTTALAMAVMMLLVPLALLPMNRKVRGSLLFVVLVAGVGVLLSPPGARLLDQGRELLRFDVERATTARTDGWKTALHMFRQEPWTGVGFGAYAARFTPAKETLLDQDESFYQFHVGLSTFSNAHSEPLEWMAETGLVGIAALAVALFFGGARLRRSGFKAAFARADFGELKGKRREKAEDEWVEARISAVLVLCTLAGFAILALTYFPLRVGLLGYPLALLLASLAVEPRSDEAGDQEESQIQHWLQRPGVRAGAMIALVLMLLVSFDISRKRLRSSARLFLAESMATEMVRQNKVYPTVLGPITEPLAETLLETPWDERLALALGSYNLLIREPEKALVWYDQSMAVAPRPETLFNIGRAKLALGDQNEAVRFFARSVRLDRFRLRVVPDHLKAMVEARIQSGEPLLLSTADSSAPAARSGE